MPQRISRISFSSFPREFAGCAVAVVVGFTLLHQTIVPARADHKNARLVGMTQGGATSPGQVDKDTRLLELGKPIERELTGGPVHYYRVTLASGQYLHLVVDQRGIDVVVTVFGPEGKKLAEVDSPNGTLGPEPVPLVAEVSGSYRVEVRSVEHNAGAGLYEIRIAELRNATAVDRNRIAAQRAFAGAGQLSGAKTPASVMEAIKKYEEALLLWQAAGEQGMEADTLTRIGLAHYDLGNTRKAIESLTQGLSLYRIVKDRRGESEILSNLGGLHAFLGENEMALDCLGQALEIARAMGRRELEAGALRDIGQIYANLGEKQKALDHSLRALSLMRDVGDRRGEAYTLNNIGGVYSELGEKLRAIQHYEEALARFRALGHQPGQAMALINIGAAYRSLGDRERALECLGQALEVARAVSDRRGEAVALNNIGLVHRDAGDYQKALEYYTRALPLRRALGDPSGEAYTRNDIGFVYGSLGEVEKALDYYGKALALRRAVGDRKGEATTLAGIARVERHRGNLLEARSLIEAAIKIVESLRTKVASQELRASYFASAHDYYEFHVDLLMELSKRRPSDSYDRAALQASERARARGLLESLTEARIDIRQGVDPGLLKREGLLRRQLDGKSTEQMRLLSGRHIEEQATALRKEIEEILTEYEETEAQIRATSPHYAALTQPQPLSSEEIQLEVLDRDTLLLEYSLGSDRSYLWALTPETINSFELPKQAEIEKAARRVYELMTARNQRIRFETAEERRARIAKADADYPVAAAALSQMLLGPVAARLQRKRLLIVAEGALQYIPFGSLPVPVVSGQWPVVSGEQSKGPARMAKGEGQKPGNNWSLTTDHRPLIVDHEVVSLPSASTLGMLRRELAGRRPAPKTLVVLADPVFAKDDERIKAFNDEKEIGQQSTAAAQARGEGALLESGLERALREMGGEQTGTAITRLPFTRREAKAILAFVPPRERKEALDFDASRATATSAELGQYRIVHFATHGFLNSLHPELSGLVLSLVDQKGGDQDGFLRAAELYNLKLPAELVVLSACRTGLGKEIKGEGLVGLTRGFMYAGAARVAVSLWDVSDEATAELMARFYKGMLAGGLRPASALKAAQVSIWKEKGWQAPYYWAAFVLQGEPN